MSRLFRVTSYKGEGRWAQAERDATQLFSDLVQQGFKAEKICHFPEKVVVVWEGKT